MKIYQIDPTTDARWAELVDRHPRASVFHTCGWLRTLRNTYGYEPIAFTTSPPTGDLENGIVFCRVKSWLTGRRLISLPFSDHCDPLCDSSEDLGFMIRFLQTTLDHQRWKYLEIRPVSGEFDRASNENTNDDALTAFSVYFLHVLDLRPALRDIFKGLDRDSAQRRVQRAERAGLTEKTGGSDDLLKDFYRLFVLTRSRHHLPPLPRAWFRNLIDCQRGSVDIRLAYAGNTPAAGILTLRFRDTVYVKYGCADSRLNRLGATPWLLWRAIVSAKSRGATKFDMGRTEEAHFQLLAFKNHWVPEPRRMTYWMFPGDPSLCPTGGWKLKLAQRLFSFMPNRLLTLTGRLIYRHIA